MAAAAPVAIGTRGTVGSLVKKEIDYFTKFELEGRGNSGSWKPPHAHTHAQIVEMDCRMGPSSSSSRPSFWLSISGWNWNWKRKKRRGGSVFVFLPTMCSAAEVADTDQLNRIPGFNYRILKNDVDNNNFHV